MSDKEEAAREVLMAALERVLEGMEIQLEGETVARLLSERLDRLLGERLEEMTHEI